MSWGNQAQEERVVQVVHQREVVLHRLHHQSVVGLHRRRRHQMRVVRRLRHQIQIHHLRFRRVVVVVENLHRLDRKMEVLSHRPNHHRLNHRLNRHLSHRLELPRYRMNHEVFQ